MMVSLGIGDGSHRQMVEAAVRMGSGHLLIQKPGYQEKGEIDLLLSREDIKRVEDWVLLQKGRFSIQNSLKRCFASGLASSADGATGVQIIGVEPELERVASLFEEKIIQGEFLSVPGYVSIGQGVARKLEVDIDDKIVLMAQGVGSPDIESIMVRVGGILATGLEDLDQILILISLEELQQFLKINGRVHQAAIFFSDQDLTEGATLNARKSLKDLEVLSWSDALPELRDAIVVDDGGNYVFQFFIFLLIAFTVMNTLLMSVLERNREFSLLDALGLTPVKRFWMVILEGICISILSALVGFVLGYSSHLYFYKYGLPLDIFYSGEMSAAGVVIDPILYSHLSMERILGSIGIVFGLTLVLAILPAIRAAKGSDIHALSS